ncbi:hypothetical protein [Rossellomorea sp. NPDC077527]|uniref:hypothetical protein n=1 Tax=Rossellomorea sp. NPDC077527 TaxID=3364510 RepID=UPI0037C79C23
MFFKKKPKEEEADYCVAIFVDEHTEEEVYERFSDHLFYEVDSIGVISEATLSAKMIEPLQEKFPAAEIKAVSFAVLKIDRERIQEETKKMESKYKWRKFFDTIPIIEYLKVEDEVMYDFQNTLLYTHHIEEVIEYLKGIEMAEQHDEEHNVHPNG